MAGRGVRVWESLCGGGSGGAGRPGRGSGLITLPVAGWGKARSACRVRGAGSEAASGGLGWDVRAVSVMRSPDFPPGWGCVVRRENGALP